MERFESVVQAIQSRIVKGDYTLDGFPSERRLADGLGVCRVTARKAVQRLVSAGVLARRTNGRLEVSREAGGERPLPRVAFLAPAFASPFVQHIRLAAERVGLSCGLPVRAVDFVHEDDPAIGAALDNFPAALVTGLTTTAPYWVREKLTQPGRRVVSIESDLTAWGVPSLVLFPPFCVRALLEHLAKLGHRIIHCLNTLPMIPEVERRIEQWRAWVAERGLAGELLNDPVPYYQSPMSHAYAFAHRLLKKKRLVNAAVFVTAEFSAIGVIRACIERHVRLGRELSLCSLGGDGFYRYLNPTLTVLEMPRPEDYLEPCLQWLGRSDEAWSGPLLIAPPRLPLFRGESTGAPAVSRRD
ncbi:MAG: substrate-binding domain-containing protein [Planctomycetota bacterium]